mmetsp:Transcript_4107/g.4700  ORF Transcript_4107/g.4700 Transcript_4107/m.4700 type:complete len:108 (-) Transcript_4107:147-470(-)
MGSEQLLDVLMLGLRVCDGLLIKDLVEQFGSQRIIQLIDALKDPTVTPRLVSLLDGQDEPVPLEEADIATIYRVRLTDPEGFLLSNEVLSSLFTRLMESPWNSADNL